MHKTRIAVLGAGGLGKAAARIIQQKDSLRLTAICDSKGYVINSQGLDGEEISRLSGTVGDSAAGVFSDDSIGALIKHKEIIDGVFVALPNLPNNFIPSIVKRFIEAGVDWVFVDALKRTRAMELMFKLDNGLKNINATYITGAGATPGLLTAAAVIAAQSYVKVDKVDISWGVGVANWEEYKATVREDIGHLPGFNVEKAGKMTDRDVEDLLDKTGGKLELSEMEHADDILLEKVGVIESRDQVAVGGVIDTRRAEKPQSTVMTLTGKTFDGKTSSHRFVLGDETCMAANVIGPALGYLKRALWLKERSIYGIFGSTEFMPMVAH
ncbi:MAG: saccharopine dehydrogenase-like oxidoreductase [bacterium]